MSTILDKIAFIIVLLFLLIPSFIIIYKLVATGFSFWRLLALLISLIIPIMLVYAVKREGWF